MANIRCHVAVLSLRELFLFYTVVYSRILCALLLSIFFNPRVGGRDTHDSEIYSVEAIMFPVELQPYLSIYLSIFRSSYDFRILSSVPSTSAASICHSLFSVLSSLYLTHLFMYLDINDE